MSRKNNECRCMPLSIYLFFFITSIVFIKYANLNTDLFIILNNSVLVYTIKLKHISNNKTIL
ncbi:hypothetical protein [Bacillus cereus]|uniref:hypothetical protein n=1 Tax=Bacillus cereus TaxID=1396 RepID=UPI00396F5852